MKNSSGKLLKEGRISQEAVGTFSRELFPRDIYVQICESVLSASTGFAVTYQRPVRSLYLQV